MSIKSKAEKAALGAGFMGATTLGSIGITSVMGIPTLVVVPATMVGGAIGAKHLLKELKEEKKEKELRHWEYLKRKRKLKKVV